MYILSLRVEASRGETRVTPVLQLPWNIRQLAQQIQEISISIVYDCSNANAKSGNILVCDILSRIRDYYCIEEAVYNEKHLLNLY
jgi:hypothetical protein